MEDSLGELFLCAVEVCFGGVLILVLVEDSLGASNGMGNRRVHCPPVLILVLVEDSLGGVRITTQAESKVVLILVLAEDSLGESPDDELYLERWLS